MADFSVVASEIESIARHLRLAGEGELVRSLQKAMTDAARPAGDDIRRALPDYLPNRYAATVDADLAIRTSSRLIGDDAGVSLIGSTRGTKRRRLRRLEAGVLAHPLYGNRGHWFYQGPVGGGMRPRFFAGPAEDAAPRVREAILRALDDVASKATSKGA